MSIDFPTPEEAEKNAVSDLPTEEVLKSIIDGLNKGVREFDLDDIISRNGLTFKVSGNIRKEALMQTVSSVAFKHEWAVVPSKKIVERGDFRGDKWNENHTMLKFKKGNAR